MDTKRVLDLMQATAFATPSRGVIDIGVAALGVVRRLKDLELVFEFDEDSNINSINICNPGETRPAALGSQFCQGWRIVVTPESDEMPSSIALIELGHNKHWLRIGVTIEGHVYIWPDRFPSQRCWMDWREGDDLLDKLPDDRWLARAKALAEKVWLTTWVKDGPNGPVVVADVE